MKNKAKKGLALLLSIVMVLSGLGGLSLPVRAEGEGSVVAATSTDASQQQESTGDVSGEIPEDKRDNSGQGPQEDHVINYFPEDGSVRHDKTNAEAFGNEYAVEMYEEQKAAYMPAETSTKNILDGYTEFTSDQLNSHKIIVDGAEVSSGATIDPAVNFRLELEFELSITEMATGGLNYYFVLPDHISIGNQGSASDPITLYNSNMVAIGTYFIQDDVMYVSFPGYYDRVVAYFDMEGSWSDSSGVTQIRVPWSDRTDIYNIDLCDLSIQKTQSGYITQPDGSLKTSFSIKTSPKSQDATITGITFSDVFSHSSHLNIIQDSYENPDGPAGEKYAVKVSHYNANKTLKEVKYYKLADIGNGDKFDISGIDIESGGYFIVEYEANVPLEERIKIDAANGTDSYKNTAKSSYEYTDSVTGQPVTLSASAEVKSEYDGSDTWIMKNASDETKTKNVSGTEKVVVPYVINVNKRRAYSLGGSAVKDEITDFVGGSVVYDTTSTATTYVERITKDIPSGENITQYWVLLDSATFASLKGLCSASSDTALQNIRNDAGLSSALVNAVNAAYGTSYTSFDDDLALKYVFTDNESNDFVWIMPDDTTPTSYTIHYDTIVDQTVGSFKNGASLWFTDYEGVPSGPGAGWTRPIKKVMNSTKTNYGVYIGSDGNYYVDYKITVGVEAGSAGFEDIAVRDLFPYHTVTLDDGKEYEVFDWLAGFDADDVDISNMTSMDNVNLVSNAIKISSTSTEQSVQDVVDNAWAGYFYEVSGDTSVESFIRKDYYPWSSRTFEAGDSIWSGKPKGGIYYGSATSAGQFVVKNDMYHPNGKLKFKKGSTYTPGAMIIWLDDIPGSEIGYDIDIEFTMQVNPELIEKMPEILQNSGEEYIVNTNSAETWTSFRSNVYDGNAVNFRFTGRMQTMSSPYWIGIKNNSPGLNKTVVGPDSNNEYVKYNIVADPNKDIAAVNQKYELSDVLNLSGMKYKDDSFTIYDESDNVVWSNAGKSVAAKYSRATSKVSFNVTASDNTSNGFSFTFDNTNGDFTDASGMFMKLRIEYEVEMEGFTTDTTIQNTAGLFELTTDDQTGEVKKTSLGEATVEYAIDKAIDKHLDETADNANQYTAKYYIDVNPKSENAKKIVTVNAGTDNETTTTEDYKVGDTINVTDQLSSNQTLIPDSLKVYKYKGDNFVNAVELTNEEYQHSIDPDTNELKLAILINDLSYKYRIVYSSRIDGASNTLVTYSNVAKMDDCTAKEDKILDKTLKFEYSEGSNAYVYQIDLHKFDQYAVSNSLEATFDLYKLVSGNWQLVTTGDPNYEKIKTDSNGVASIANSVVNTQPILKVENETYYKLVEVENADGYVLDATPIYYYVSELGTYPDDSSVPEQVPVDSYKLIKLKNKLDDTQSIPVIEISNQKFGLDIHKTDKATDSLLTGAEFTLYSDSACTKVLASAKDELSTSADGTAIYDNVLDGNILFRNIELPTNVTTLYMKETVVPEGYKDTKEVYTLTLDKGRVVSATGSVSGDLVIDDTGRLSAVTVPNEFKSGRLEISKQVTNADDNHDDKSFSFAALITDSTGKLVTGKLIFTKTEANGTVTTGTYSNGTVFYLKHDEKMEISNIPTDSTYKVTEVKDNDYLTSCEVVDMVGNDAKTRTEGNSFTGTIDESGKDVLNFENSANVSLQILKNAVSDTGETILKPDGMTFRVKLKSQILATVVYNSVVDKYRLDSQAYSDIRIENVPGGFKLHGLHYSSDRYTVEETNANVPGKAYILTANNGAYITNNNSFNFYATSTTYSGNPVDNDIEFELINTYTDNFVEVNLETAKEYFEASGADSDGDGDGDNKVRKTVNPGDFTFNLISTPSQSATSAQRTLVETKSTDNDEKVKFSTQKIVKEGTSYFIIEEVRPDSAAYNSSRRGYVADGIKYDTNSLYVTVKTSKDGSNQLQIDSIEYSKNGVSSADPVAMVNVYEAKGSATVGGKKKYNRQIPANAFSLTMKEYTDNTYSTAIAGKEWTKNISGSSYGTNESSYSFSKIDYEISDVGKHYYQITENTPEGVNGNNKTKDGITYDTDPKNIVVDVTDNGDGTLSAEVTDDQGRTGTEASVDIINEYDAVGNITFGGKKTLNNHTIGEDQFTYTVTEYSDSRRQGVKNDATGTPITYTCGVNAASSMTVDPQDPEKASASAAIKFPTITYHYSDIGTHYYRVKEVIPDGADTNYYLNGYTYDPTVYDVNVTVSDNGNGQLTVTANLDKDNLNFINLYSATGSVSFTGTKTLVGRALADNEFSIVADRTVKDRNGNVSTTQTIPMGVVHANGEITFLDQNYTEADIGKEFTYVIHELIPTQNPVPAVVYDNGSYTAVVNVAEGTDEHLIITKTVTDKDGNAANTIDFTNLYSAAGSITFEASKQLLGRDLSDRTTKIFTFDIYEKDVSGNLGTTPVASGTNDANGKVVFSPINFSLTGSGSGVNSNLGLHNYVLKERIPSGVNASNYYEGYTYDDTEIELSVEAIDHGDGSIDFTVTGASASGTGLTYTVDTNRAATFINKYEAKGSIDLSGTKTLTGRTLDDGEFTFKAVESKYDNSSNSYVETGRVFNGKSDINGDITFDTIEYVKNSTQDDQGLYQYVVSEVIPNDANKRGGVTYDTTEIKLDAMVVDSTGDGQLYITTSDQTDIFDFTNVYEAKGQLEITTKKTAVTDDNVAYDDTTASGEAVGNEFTVEVYEIANDGSETLVQDGKVKVGETATLPAIEYDLKSVGIHHYRICEKDDKLPGYTYDDKEYFLTAKVEDGRNGILLVSLQDGIVPDVNNGTTFKDGNAAFDAAYINLYSAIGEVQLSADKKVLNISDSVIKTEMKADMFTFNLSEYDPKTGMFVDVESAKSGKDGKVEFNSIKYTMKNVGTHIYKIEEDKTSQISNILYTAQPVYAVVKVSNNGDGTLMSTINYTRGFELRKIEDGNYTPLAKAEMENTMTKIGILKTAEKGGALAGAKLEILDDKGNTVFEFVSTDKEVVLYGLNRNTVYTLHEKEAPEGYELAADVKFKLDENGNAQIVGNDGSTTAVKNITMLDKEKKNTPNTPDFTSSKDSQNTATGSARTGDAVCLVLVIVLMALSFAGIIVVGLKKKSFLNK